MLPTAASSSQHCWRARLVSHGPLSHRCFSPCVLLYFPRPAQVFDELLLDADHALNNGNWQWLSCSCFFYQYFRCYSPVAFGKKTDPEGAYIRKYVPALAKYPKKFIF